MRKVNGNEVFGRIQSKLRFSQVGIQQVVAILERYATEKSVKCNADVMKEIFRAELAVDLSEEELLYCVKRFQYSLYPGNIDMARFLSAIDLTKPNHHQDPDYFADNLPQPYRLISKIIEMEILDAAWLEITRIHPEYIQGSDGLPISIPRNQNLKIAHLPTVEKLTDYTSVNAAPVGNLFFTLSVGGSLHLYDPRVERSICSVQITFPVDEMLNNKDLEHKRISPLIISSISEPSSMFVVRIAVLCRVETIETKAPEPDPAAKAPAKKGTAPEPAATQPAKVAKYLVTIVDAMLKDTDKVINHSSLLQIVYKCFVDSHENDVLDDARCDISIDGELLSLATPRGCHLFKLSSLDSSSLVNMVSHLVEDAEVEHPDPTVNVLNPVCEMLEYSSANDQSLFQSIAVPLFASNNTTKATENDKVYYYHTAIALFFQTNQKWLLIGFQISNSDATMFKPVILSTWRLQSIVTAINFCDGRAMLALGFQDGSINLWNIYSRSIVLSVLKHEYPVTSVAFGKFGTISEAYLLSGAYDGTLCFTTIKIPKADQKMAVLGIVPLFDSCNIKTIVNEFRSDVSNSFITNIICSNDLPIACVHYSTGEFGAYDFQTGTLLGKLVLLKGMEAKKYSWGPVRYIDHSVNIENQDKVTLQSTLPLVPRNRIGKCGIFPNSIRGISYSAPIIASSHGYILIIFQKEDKHILATYDSSGCANALFPGVASLCKQAQNYAVEDIIKTLKPQERIDPNLTYDMIPGLLASTDQTGEKDSSIIKSGPNSGRKGNSAPNSGRVASGTLNISKSKPTLKIESNNYMVTHDMEKLHASPLRVFALERLVYPFNVVEKTISESKSNSRVRDKRISNILDEMKIQLVNL